MRFKSPRPCVELHVPFVRYESEGGLWWVDVIPTVCGEATMNVTHTGDRTSYLRVYAIGGETFVQLSALGLLMKVMARLPESIDPADFSGLMPTHSTVTDRNGWRRLARPIATDPLLVRRLAELAGLEGADVRAAVGLVCGAACGIAAGDGADLGPVERDYKREATDEAVD